jgi:phospholipase/carboxylesterase
MTEARDPRHPHAGQGILVAGAPLSSARRAIIALHGRGADAEDIAGLAGIVAPPETAIVAPRAAGHTWYPYRFLEPIERNEPYLSSALSVISKLIDEVGSAGVPADRIALLGFSQGACLALEFTARNPRRYAGVIGFSGGLIGPPGTLFNYSGSLAGTPLFLGCSDVDSHIPIERVEETAEVLGGLDAIVDLRIYPGMGHTVNEDELSAAREMLRQSL